MELFLKAIESSNGFDDSDDDLDITQSEPALSFISRPPQWCIVDKWFTMQINCTDNSLTELEALVYNSEGHILHEVLQPEHTMDKESKRVVVTIDPARKATFRLKFVNGSKGAWLHIGIHNTKNPDKCLLKSPPIKVQTNRSKRPRDNRRKPTPIVSSLSPSSVPSTGNFPGRKDRMLLIFGSNFYLWGNSPIIHLKRPDSREAIEIRPPSLIWWSDSLLECQLPECHQDLEVKVANYDMVFGDGKTLKVIPTQETDSKQVTKPIQTTSTATTTYVATGSPTVRDNSHFVIEYSPGEGVDDITPKAKVVLYLNNSFDQIPVMTPEKTENVNYKALTAVLRVYNKETEEKLIEVSRPADSVSQNSVIFDFSFVIPPQRLKDSSEPLFIAAYLRKDQNQFIIDPKTNKPLVSEKPLFMSLMDEDDEDRSPESQPAVSPVVVAPKPIPHHEEVSTNHTSLLAMVRKCDSLQKLNDWELVLSDTLREVREQKLRFLPKPPPILASSPTSSAHSILRTSSAPSITSVELKPQPKKIELRESTDFDDEDDEPISKRGKVAVNESKTEVSLPTPDPKQKNGIVYWKFFNPGNRTFLELTEGKLQIIGSRRIQMLIESVPPNSKFVSAHLYVQKNDNFEIIENCARCKENGIPNVFCVLPRRGREHDFPWITFRITCTSTAKHWKGSLFWIGAEFLIDPTQGTIMKVFSPPIHVQSKVKGKDLVSSSSSVERVGSRDSMRLDTPSPSPSTSNTPSTPLNLRVSGPVPNVSASPNPTGSTSPSPSASPATHASSPYPLVQPQVQQPQIQLQALAAAAQQATVSSTPVKSPTANAPVSASPPTTTQTTVSSGNASPVANNSSLSALLSSMMANPNVLKESGQPIAPVKT